MDTLTSIKVFRQIVDSGSFAKAAERLELSTAMVSKHVMHVERRLGVRLLNRNTRSLSLTEPGRLYFERCQHILEVLQATEVELGSLSSAPRGTLGVSVPSSASGRWLAEFLAEYRRQYPEVLVDLSFEDRFVNLVDEGYDLALRIASRREYLPPGLIARPLRSAMFYLAASRDYVRRRGAPKYPEDLRTHDFIAVGDLLNGVPKETGDFPARVVLRYRSMDGAANAVAAGIGIAPLPAMFFDDPAFRDTLLPVLPDYPLQEAVLYAVYATRKFIAPKLCTFVDFIAEHLSRTPERKVPHAQAVEAPPSAASNVPKRALRAA